MFPDHMIKTPAMLVTKSHGGRDEYGDVEYVTTSTAIKCHIQQVASTEDEDVEQITRWRVFLPRDVAMAGWDEIVVAGLTYTLNGDPWPVLNPRTNTVNHIEAEVTRVR